MAEKETEHLSCKFLLGVVVHSLLPVSGRQRQVDLCEFEAILVYIVYSKTARATSKPVLTGLGGKYLYPLSHLPGLRIVFNK